MYYLNYTLHIKELDIKELTRKTWIKDTDTHTHKHTPAVILRRDVGVLTFQ